jgi:alpha-beta hydrolase superfamily lysophospholipase
MVKLKPETICKKLEFSSDGYQLRGILHLPALNSPAIVIGSHGLLSSSDSPKQIELARRCNAFGIAYFRFDHRGCGRSQGDFAEVTSLSARSSDLLAAVRLMREHTDTGNQVGLFGSSMGGATCLAAAVEAKAESLVTFAAPVRSRSLNGKSKKQHNPDGTPSQLDKLDLEFDISEKLAGIRHILIFHGETDNVVPFSDALEIYQKVQEPKKLIRQSGGDHLMSNPLHQKEFIRETALWFKTYFELSCPQKSQ